MLLFFQKNDVTFTSKHSMIIQTFLLCISITWKTNNDWSSLGSIRCVSLDKTTALQHHMKSKSVAIHRNQNNNNNNNNNNKTVKKAIRNQRKKENKKITERKQKQKQNKNNIPILAHLMLKVKCIKRDMNASKRKKIKTLPTVESLDIAL